jgi:hypothetical protein
VVVQALLFAVLRADIHCRPGYIGLFHQKDLPLIQSGLIFSDD